MGDRKAELVGIESWERVASLMAQVMVEAGKTAGATQALPCVDEAPALLPALATGSDLEDFVVAIAAICELASPHARVCSGASCISVEHLGYVWLVNAKRSLDVRMDALLRPFPVVRTERQAMAIIKTMSTQLKAAADALDAAAAFCKNAPNGTMPASRAREAGTRALRAAQELMS